MLIQLLVFMLMLSQMAGKSCITQQITHFYQICKLDHVDFFLLSVTLCVSEKRSSIHWKNVTIFPGGIIIGLKGVFDILNKKIKSNQQSVQTLVSLLTFTSLMFLLALMTYVGSWFLTVKCPFLFLPVLLSQLILSL